MEENKKENMLRIEDSGHWKYRQLVNHLMNGIALLCFIVVLVPLISVVVQVFANGLQAFSFEILFREGGSPLNKRTGIFHAILGTLQVTVIGSLLGIPLGIATGVYLEYFGKGRLNNLLRIGIDTMVSIPTIITGVVVWGLIVLAMNSFSVLAGGISLAFIMIPIIAKTTEEMIHLVPKSYDEAGYALGLSESRTAMSIVIPMASKGIASGVLIAVARIMGETAPLLFTAFFSQRAPRSITEPSATLPVLIFNYAIAPYDNWHNLAWVAAMILVALNFGVIFITRKMFGGTPGKW
ncbi:MAG: phosphate ABC transporter permease PstA [Methanobacteriota archaeon]|nr:MAG: phosphate ABC transporter permease PstA [Euryarchaeota archaeon]